MSTLPNLDTTVLNMEIFGQIMEMDEADVTHEFSRSIVEDFFQQAQTTLKDINQAFPKQLPRVSTLGHFLKGSSATVGLSCVERSCQRIQQFGKLMDPETDETVEPEVAVQELKDEIEKVKVLLGYCEAMLMRSYGSPLTEKHKKALSVPLMRQLATLEVNRNRRPPPGGGPYGRKSTLPVG